MDGPKQTGDFNNFFEAILSQDDEYSTFVTLYVSGAPAGQEHGRSDYWSLSRDDARKLGIALIEKAAVAEHLWQVDANSQAALDQEEAEPDPTVGLPPDLARILRDPSITIDRDKEVRLADGRTLWEHLHEWRNAPSNTASALDQEEERWRSTKP